MSHELDEPNTILMELSKITNSDEYNKIALEYARLLDIVDRWYDTEPVALVMLAINNVVSQTNTKNAA